MRHWSSTEILDLIKKLRRITENFEEPMSHSVIDRFGRDPFLILVSCLLSLRTRDTVTLPVSLNLFTQLKTPEDFIDVSLQKLEDLIYPVGFYKRKALQLQKMSMILVKKYHGGVPATEEELLALPGVGIKTTNLVLGLAYEIPAICVDIHVHRISNILGLVSTCTPEQTEQALKRILPKQYWIEWNKLLVQWGQNICKPTEPYCDLCFLGPICKPKRQRLQ